MRYAMRLLALAGTTVFVVFSILLIATLVKFYSDRYRYFDRFSIYELMHDDYLKMLIVTALGSVSSGFAYRRLARSPLK